MTEQTERSRTAYAWLALALLGMALLIWANARPETAGLIPAPWDKLAHMLIFGGLSLLLVLGGCAPWLGFFIVAAFGASDELRQLGLPGRSASWGDLGVDWLAAALVFSVAGCFGRDTSGCASRLVK